MEMLNQILPFLNANSGGIVAIATVFLAVLTARYVISTDRLVKQNKKQATFLVEQEQLKPKRAIRAVIKELEFNKFAATFENWTPFLDDAYSSSIWAFAEVSISEDTLKKNADA